MIAACNCFKNFLIAYITSSQKVYAPAIQSDGMNTLSG